MSLTHSDVYQLLVALHLIGLTFGLGGATISDFTFMTELFKRGKIAPEVIARMRSFTQMVWLGLILLSVSGIGLLVVDGGAPLQLPGFLAKMVVVAVLVANGTVLTFYITPRLPGLNFADAGSRPAHARLHRIIFILGAVSTASWYGAFFIAMFKSVVALPFVEYLLVYLAALFMMICGALALEWLFSRKKWAAQPQSQNDMPKVTPVPAPNPVATVPPLPQASATSQIVQPAIIQPNVPPHPPTPQQ